MDIGNVMHVRRQTGRPELVVVTDKVGDNAEIQTVKELIRRATAVRPEDRPTAAWILQQLNIVVKVLQITEIDFFLTSSDDIFHNV